MITLPRVITAVLSLIIGIAIGYGIGASTGADQPPAAPATPAQAPASQGYVEVYPTNHGVDSRHGRELICDSAAGFTALHVGLNSATATDGMIVRSEGIRDDASTEAGANDQQAFKVTVGNDTGSFFPQLVIIHTAQSGPDSNTKSRVYHADDQVRPVTPDERTSGELTLNTLEIVPDGYISGVTFCTAGA